MTTRAAFAAFLLFLAGCSGAPSPAIELRSIPLPLADDAGAVDPAPGELADAGPSVTVDASEPADSGPGVVLAVDAAPATPDAGEALNVDAGTTEPAPSIVCTFAGPAYGKLCVADPSQTTLYLCTDGDAGAACPATDHLVQFSPADGTSWCCGK